MPPQRPAFPPGYQIEDPFEDPPGYELPGYVQRRDVRIEREIAKALDDSMTLNRDCWAVTAVANGGSVAFLRCVGFGRCRHAARLDALIGEIVDAHATTQIFLGVDLNQSMMSPQWGYTPIWFVEARHGVHVEVAPPGHLARLKACGLPTAAPEGCGAVFLYFSKDVFSDANKAFMRSGSASAPVAWQTARRVGAKLGYLAGAPVESVVSFGASCADLLSLEGRYRTGPSWEEAAAATMPRLSMHGARKAAAPAGGSVLYCWRDGIPVT